MPSSPPSLPSSAMQRRIPSVREMRHWWQNTRYRYEPTPSQWPVHLTPHREILIAGGERGGKSMTAGMFVLPRIPTEDLIWIIAKDYNLARPEFQYIRDSLLDIGLIDRISDPVNPFQPRTLITTTGLEIATVTAADMQKIAARAPSGIILAEAAQLDYEVRLRARGRVAEKRGWLLLEGTFENAEPWYPELWEDWQGGTPDGQIAYSLPSWENTVIFPGGYNDAEMVALRKAMSEERFQERHGGIPVPPSTAVFPEFRYSTHVGLYPYTPGQRVELAIDPGYAGAYAVCALQWDNACVYVIDEIYEQRMGVKDIIHLARQRNWWEDVDPRMGGVIDIAGKQHHGDRSQVEWWALHPSKGGAGITLRSRYIPIESGIERLRSFLISPLTGNPRLFYNAESTKHSQTEYKRYKYPEDKSGKAQREKPIDRDNHAVKAVTYWLTDRYGYTPHIHAATAKPFRIVPGDSTDGEEAFDPSLRQRRRSRELRQRRQRRMASPFRFQPSR